MSEFWSGAMALALVALLVMWVPVVLQRKSRETLDFRKENLRIHSERVAELQALVSDGQLEAAEAQRLQAELDRSLLLDADADSDTGYSPSTPPGSRGWVIALALSVIVPLTSWQLYRELGAEKDLQLTQQLETISREPNADIRLGLMRTLVTSLEEKLVRDADDTRSRYLLARTQMELGRYPEAVSAYAHLVADNPEAPQLLAEYAQARYAASGRVLGPETADILRRVVHLDPANRTALGLLGLGSFNNANYAAAERYWSMALQVTQEPGGRQALQAGIERARQRMGASEQEASANAASGPQVRVQVRIPDSVRGQLQGDESVFVFARHSNGPRMPLAAVRLRVADLPTTVLLDDSRAMSPAARLSDAKEVAVQARVSLSGQPIPQSGDHQSASAVVKVGEQVAEVELEINTTLP